MNKKGLLHELVQKRRRADEGTVRTGYTRDYKKIGDFHGGAYDPDDCVVPWSRVACNTNTDLMLLAQDWASEDFLGKAFSPARSELGYDAELATNKNLFVLLKNCLGREFSSVYATDAFVFVKPGAMGAKIPSKDLELSVANYAIPQIQIVAPKIVLCLGGGAFNAVRAVLGFPYCGVKASHSAAPIRLGHAQVLAVTHPGGLGVASAGGMQHLEIEWQRVNERLRQ